MNDKTTAFKVGQRAMYVGERFGKKCNFPVVLREQNPHVPECFGVDAVFADNVGYTPDNWVHVRDLALMPEMSPTTVDVSTIGEYGLTQKLSNSIRVY